MVTENGESFSMQTMLIRLWFIEKPVAWCHSPLDGVRTISVDNFVETNDPKGQMSTVLVIRVVLINQGDKALPVGEPIAVVVAVEQI